MAGNKKRDLLNESLGDDSQGSLESFLDNLESIDDSSDEPVDYQPSKKSSIGLLFAKVFVATVVVISSVAWFIWPEIKNNNSTIAQNYQEDGKLERVVGRLEALEEALKLKNADKVRDEPLNVSQNRMEAEAVKLAQQRVESARLAQQKAAAVKLAERKQELLKFAQVKAEIEAKKKAEAERLLKQKAEVKAKLLAIKRAQEASVQLVKQQAEATKVAQKVIKAVHPVSEQAKSVQKKSEALKVVTMETPATPATDVVSQEVTRPYVPFAGKKFYIYKVSANIANVRSAPSSDSGVVAKLKRGTKVVVLKKEGEWYQIRLRKSRRAWVYYTLLK